jgi:hypothetical protein
MDSLQTRYLASVLLATFLTVPSASWAAFAYDEASNGDLSNDGLAPTVLDAGEGDNTLGGYTVSGDLDYLTFNVGPGLQLEAIMLWVFDSTDDLAFMAVQSGSQFTEPPVGTDPGNLLGWVHFGPALLGTDILDDMGLGDGAIGFTPPLPSGDYSFWIQQTGSEQVNYQFDFVISAAPVPVPAAAYLFGSGLLALGGYARRLRKGKA